MRYFITLFFLLFCLSAQSETKRVLFIGNSYTFENNLPHIISNIAASTDDELIFSISAFSGYSLKDHSENSTTLGLIRSGFWDLVVLQEYSRYPSEPLDWLQVNVFPYIRSLDSEINAYNPGSETMFYMTWGRRDGDTERCARLPSVCTYFGMDNLTRERYMLMAQTYNGIVSPVGAVWRYIRENYPSIELYDTDGSHPSEAGSYAAACCFYTAIFKKDPTLISYNYNIDSGNATRIKTAVREVVFFNPDRWYLEVNNQYTGTPGSAIFNNTTYTIASSAGTGGSISPQGNVTVDYGSNRTFTITPNTGYNLLNVVVDNISVGPVSSYTFRNITENHRISATFSLSTFTINSTAGTGGSISPPGVSTINYGSGLTFNITPNTGFRISDVLIDNISQGAISSYTFNNVTSDHTISVSFTPITFNINSTSGSGGSISPQGITTVNYGDERVYSITPATGYRIANVIVDNTSVGPVSEYTFTNIVQNHTISATFSIITYVITAESNSGGSITPDEIIVVNYGSDLSFTIKPDYGFRIYEVRVDGRSTGAASSLSLNNITDNHNIYVIFEPIPVYTVTAFPIKGGSITPAGSIKLFEGSNQTYLIEPDKGYRIYDVVVDNLSVGAMSEYTFSNIASNHIILASFTTGTDVKVYPNPFIDELNIHIVSPEENLFDITIMDLNGNLVYSQSKVSGNTTIPIKLVVPKGFYLLRLLLQNNKIAIIKITKG